jgi:hypothetical protein
MSDDLESPVLAIKTPTNGWSDCSFSWLDKTYPQTQNILDATNNEKS